MKIGPSTPVLRIFDVAKARAFYLDYLGFSVDFEHRFEDDLPLYMGLSRDACTLHLTEHHGDCCPGSAVRVAIVDIAAFHAELAAQNYRYAKPGLDTQPWGSREVAVTDPFGNRIIFFENLPAG